MNIQRKEKRKRKKKVEKKLTYSRRGTSIPNTTFKYEEIEMELGETFNDVVISVNEQEEIEILECQVCV